MIVIPLLLMLSTASSFSPNIIPGKKPSVLFNQAKPEYELNLGDNYTEYGLYPDDVPFNWAMNRSLEGVSVTPLKLGDNFERALYSLVIEFDNEDIEDRVLHVLESRGERTRYFTPLGKNSNGMSLDMFNKFLMQSVAKSVGTVALQAGALFFFISGDFNDLVHQLNTNGSTKEIVATTGVISFLTSKALETIVDHGDKALNPFYHLKTFWYLSPKAYELRDGSNLYIGETIDEIMIRLDPAYHGSLQQGGLNPELRVSFTQRAKSDHDWIREIKRVIKAISKKRYELNARNLEQELRQTDHEEQVRPSTSVTINVDKLIVHCGDDVEGIKSKLKNKISQRISEYDRMQDIETLEQIIDDCLESALVEYILNN